MYVYVAPFQIFHYFKIFSCKYEIVTNNYKIFFSFVNAMCFRIEQMTVKKKRKSDDSGSENEDTADGCINDYI